MKMKILKFLVPGLLLSTQIYAATGSTPTLQMKTMAGKGGVSGNSDGNLGVSSCTSPFGIANYSHKFHTEFEDLFLPMAVLCALSAEMAM